MKNAIAIALIALTVSAGCTTGVGVIEREIEGLSKLAQGESITLLPDQWLQGTSDDSNLAECVLDAMQSNAPGLRYIPHQKFRDTLFPWLEPETLPPNSQLEELLKNPLVADAVRKLDLRYIIIIKGNTVEEGKGAVLFGQAGIWGALWGKRKSRMAATLWDLKKIGPAPSVDVEAQGRYAFASAILPVLFIPAVTEGPACRELGERLVRYLKGDSVLAAESIESSPVSPETE